MVSVPFLDLFYFWSKLLWEYQYNFLLPSNEGLAWWHAYICVGVLDYRFLPELLEQPNKILQVHLIIVPLEGTWNYPDGHIRQYLTVCVLSWHSSGPGSTGHDPGPQSSIGTFLHSVSGEYLVVGCVRTFPHCVTGHLVHCWEVVYPWVTSSHFSSTMVSQSTESSSTTCSWYLKKIWIKYYLCICYQSCYTGYPYLYLDIPTNLVVQADVYSVVQTSGPGVSQFLTRGV